MREVEFLYDVVWLLHLLLEEVLVVLATAPDAAPQHAHYSQAEQNHKEDEGKSNQEDYDVSVGETLFVEVAIVRVYVVQYVLSYQVRAENRRIWIHVQANEEMEY